MGFLWWKTKKEKEQEKAQLKREIVEEVGELLKQEISSSKKAPAPIEETFQELSPIKFGEAIGRIYDKEILPSYEEEDSREVAPARPYSSAILSNNTLTVVLWDGSIYTKGDADKDLFHRVIGATTEGEILALIRPNLKMEVSDPDKYIIQEITPNLTRLLEISDFEQKGESLYLKGVDLSLPPVVIKGFTDLLDADMEDSEKYERWQAMKNFWYWTALNPNPESRRDLYTFIRNNDIRITPNGLLVLYRRIVSVGKGGNKGLIEFVSKSYTKIRTNKKSTKNTYIVADGSNYKLVPAGGSYEDHEELLGSVYDLYHGLEDVKDNTYTAAHDRNMRIKVGSVYAIDEDRVDRNNQYACSSGLHVASRNYDYSGFGDTPVMVLVNPSKVRAVPVADIGKMRVSEMFIVSVLEINPDGTYIDEDMDIVNFDEEYYAIGVEELEAMAKGLNILELSENHLLPAVGLESFSNIIATLRKGIADRVLTV